MKSLFLRIFLWFWVAMAVMAAVLVISSPYFTRSRPRLERWQKSAETMTRGRLDRAVNRLEQEGLDAIGRRERPPGPHVPLEIFVFDGEGNEVRGREAPRVVREIAGRAATSGVEDVERSGSLYLVARPVIGPEDEQLVAVAALHQPPRWVDLIEPRALAIRLGALVLLIGAFSLWIARYLSAPVGSLRRATQKLSAGDLSARVGQPVDRRHDEIGELARDFDAMAERLEALLDGQRRLLRDVSHELRSPLARLGVALELALLKLVQMRRLLPFTELVAKVERLAGGAPALPASRSAARVEVPAVSHAVVISLRTLQKISRRAKLLSQLPVS